MENTHFMPYENIVFAKSNGQSLSEHRSECLYKLEYFREMLGKGTEEFLENFNIDTQEFWTQLKFLVSNHDFGKMNTKFQEKIRMVLNNSEVSQVSLPKDVPHNFISPLYFTNERFSNLIQNDAVNLCAIAAMHHHGSITVPDRSIYDRQNTITLQGFDEYLGFKDGLDDLRPTEKVLEWLKEPIKTQDLRNFYFSCLRTEVTDYESLLRRRWLFSILEQYLHLSDWSASGAKIGVTVLSDPWSKIEQILANKNSSRTELRIRVQEVASTLGRRAILLAPTGSGKTEAAIKWASFQNRQRLLFSLPTRSLVDDIYYRFQGKDGNTGYFQNDTGILHAASDYTIHSNYVEDPDSHEFDRYFHRPVMVTTIDQILFSLFNIGKWDAVNFSLAHGSLIIDEIHSYDKVTLSLILELIKQTRRFQMPILLMTATLPSWIPNAIKSISGEAFDMVTVSAADKKSPWKINILNTLDLDTVAMMGKEKKVLFVVNNVRECVEVYKNLKGMDSNVRCLHSRFLQSDKKEIIEWAKSSIDGGRILVSTQVVEAGIDMDYDILVTELCPVDSLIQRAGRINRSRNPHVSADIFVYEPKGDNADINDLIYGRKPLERTREVLSWLTANDSSVQRALDYVYPEAEGTDDLNQTFELIDQMVLECERFAGNGSGKKYGDGLHSLPIKEMELPIKTRESRYVTLDVVPVEFKSEAAKGKWREYSIRVPLRSYAKYVDFNGKFPVISIRYRRDTGLQQPDRMENRDAFFI